jgi:hypothetical protein
MTREKLPLKAIFIKWNLDAFRSNCSFGSKLMVLPRQILLD